MDCICAKTSTKGCSSTVLSAVFNALYLSVFIVNAEVAKLLLEI